MEQGIQSFTLDQEIQDFIEKNRNVLTSVIGQRSEKTVEKKRLLQNAFERWEKLYKVSQAEIIDMYMSDFAIEVITDVTLVSVLGRDVVKLWEDEVSFLNRFKRMVVQE